jgi:hypothetical protein
MIHYVLISVPCSACDLEVEVHGVSPNRALLERKARNRPSTMACSRYFTLPLNVFADVDTVVDEDVARVEEVDG